MDSNSSPFKHFLIKTMKPLTEYTKNSFFFELVKREGDIAIFRGEKPDRGSVNTNWEVVRIQVTKSGSASFGGGPTIAFEPREAPPSDYQWGLHGFTAISEEAAHEKFNQLASTKP